MINQYPCCRCGDYTNYRHPLAQGLCRRCAELYIAGLRWWARCSHLGDGQICPAVEWLNERRERIVAQRLVKFSALINAR